MRIADQLPPIVPSMRTQLFGSTWCPSPRERRELDNMAIDLLALALDAAGMTQPLTIAGGPDAATVLSRGEWLNAATRGAGTAVPYVGDLVIAGRLPVYVRSLTHAIKIAQCTAQQDRLSPGIQNLEAALRWFPNGANSLLDNARSQCRLYLADNGHPALPVVQRNVAHCFEIRTPWRNDKYEYRTICGRLGRVGHVVRHRNQSAQRAVSIGTGDDAGHLIADRFGGPGGQVNLSRQNWIANRCGSYYDLESQWARKLERGIGIMADVTDITHIDDDRPFYRKVRWIEIAVDGSTTRHEMLFVNPHSHRSRVANGLIVKMPEGHTAEIIDFTRERFKQRRLN